MPGRSQNVIGALDKSGRSRTIIEAIDNLGGDVGRWRDLAVFTQALSDPQHREELFFTYVVGDLTFKTIGGTLFGFIDCKQYDIDGSPNGTYHTIWTPIGPPQDLPNPPYPDFKYDHGWAKNEQLYEPVLRVNTKSVWIFGDGSEIRTAGGAGALLTPFPDTSAVLHVSVGAVITGGSKQYEGCRGVKSAVGSSFLPPGKTFADILTEKTKVVEFGAFRVIKKEELG